MANQPLLLTYSKPVNQEHVLASLKASLHSLERLLGTQQAVVSLYMDKFPALLVEIAKKEALLGLSDRGVPMAFSLDRHSAESPDKTTLYLCKAFHRKLAKVTHPDKGGNAELYGIVNTAYKARDLLMLQSIAMFVFQEKPVSEILEGLNRRVLSRTRELQATPLFKVAVAHVCKQESKAKQLMEQYLVNYANSLTKRILIQNPPL